MRQLAAIFASGDRTEALREVTTPMLVIHGLDDTLIAPSGGRRTAELVPGAHLVEVADMGHDLPPPLWPFVVGAILGHQASAVETTHAAPAEAMS
jgi:pimeloyl-ACP methyl ester carboxylesterase